MIELNLTQFQTRKRSVVARVVRLVLGVFGTVTLGELTPFQWRQLLDLIYPEVEKARYEAAELAREFYDSERAKHLPDSWPIYLSPYSREAFYEDMDFARLDISKRGTSERVVSKASLGVAQVVEQGARNTMVRAIEEESEYLDKGEADQVRQERTGPTLRYGSGREVTIHMGEPERSNIPDKYVGRKVRGWARVPTGLETCAWCMMMVSRGPVYTSHSAGVDEDYTNSGALEAYFSDEGINVREWHPGCDCSVVPVFDDKDWPGRDRYVDTYMAWLSVTQEYDGWDKFKAFRRAYEKGEITLMDAEPVSA